MEIIKFSNKQEANEPNQAAASVFDIIQNWLAAHFPPYCRAIFLCSFTLALLTHLYRFTHLFVNHDNLMGIFPAGSIGGLTSGRWLLYIVGYLAGNFSNPWLDGMVGALMLAGACTLFAALFKIRRLLPACLMSLCMVAFPAVTATYNFMFTSSQYFLAMLLAVLAAWLLHKGGAVRFGLALVCLACSIGIYQAYFCLAAAALVTSMLLEACEGRWRDNFKGFLLTGLRYLIGLALGMVLYMIILQLCLWYTGVQLTDYQGINHMGQNLTLVSLLVRMMRGCFRLWTHFFNNPLYTDLFRYCLAASLFADVVAVGLLCFTRRLYKNIANIVQLAGLIILFPIACNSIFILVGRESDVHTLMIYPAVLLLLLPVLLGSRITAQDLAVLRQKSLQRVAMVFICGLLLLQAVFGHQFLVITNRVYTCMDLTYESVYAYFTRLTAKIEMQEGYTPETPVVIIGKIIQHTHIPNANLKGAVPLEYAINMYSRDLFMIYSTGFCYTSPPPQEIEALQARPEVQQMPCYPAEGSIATIDGVIVVKLGEEEADD